MKNSTFAPKVTAAVARKNGHTDLAVRALASAEGIRDRVRQLKPGEDAIIAMIAEAIYEAGERERDSFPEREARAAAHALAGARTVVLMKFDEYAEKAARPTKA